MSPLVALATFGLVFPAELPDKTFIASVVLGGRLAPWPAWAGVAAAFALHSAISVTAGSLIALAPHRVVEALVAAAFLAGAAWLLVGRSPQRRDQGAAPAPGATTPARAAMTSFAVVFLAEWGDITQVLMANLAARYRDPLAVAVGATAALWLVGALAVATGRRLARALPLRLLSRLAGLALLALGTASAVSAATG